MSSGPDDAFDLNMATTMLLADRSDVAMLLRVLAKQLADGFGERVSVEREGGLLRKVGQGQGHRGGP